MELKPITHFFNKKIYTVPVYQRGYSWEKKHILDLLSDIDHVIKLNSSHYTGTLTIHEQKLTEKVGLNNYQVFDVVDGQQRITTIILILSYLLKELKKDKSTKNDAEEKEQTYIEKNGSYLFRYSIDKVSEDYFRSLILESENMSSLEENIYTRNLANAKITIRDFFEEPANRIRLVDFLNAIEEKLLFNEYIVSSTAEIGVVFETMNNRGVGLSNLELVKNRLLYLISKINLGEETESYIKNLSDKVNNKWAIILKNLTLTSKVLDEDTFLNNHWIIYHGWVTDNKAKTEILDECFTVSEMVKDPKAMLSKIESYVDSLASTSLHWRFINNPTESKAFIEVENNNLRERLKIYFTKLNRLNNSTVRPLLLAFLPNMKNDAEYLLELVQLAEKFSFRLFSMNRRRADTGKNDIYRNCRRFHVKATEKKTKEEGLYYLAWYIDQYGDEDRFKIEVDELFRSDKKNGYYSWGGLNYFLYEYELALKGSEDEKVSYVFANQRNKSVEHILPQTTKNTPWAKEINGLSYAQKKRKIHSLGNLLLISKNKNSALRNSEFSIKKKEFHIGSFSENEIAKNNRNWSTNKIDKREQHLLDFLRVRWEVNTIMTEKYPYPNHEHEIQDVYEEYIEA